MVEKKYHRGVIWCPICFIKVAEKQGIHCTSWRISRDSDAPLVDKLMLEISYLKDGLNDLIDKAVKVHDRGIKKGTN